jgi:hypothetical protein
MNRHASCVASSISLPCCAWRRKSCLLFGCVAFAALLAGRSADAATVTLDMNQDPVELGWTNYANGGSYSLSGGTLTIDAPSYNEFSAPDVWETTADDSLGWSVEARVKLDSETIDYDRWYARGATIWMCPNTRTLRIFRIFSGGVGLDYISPDYAMDTTSDFHTYRIEAYGNNTNVFVDGSLIMTGTQVASGTPGMLFGDGAGENPTVSRWDYVTFTTNTVPEPSTLLLAASGILGLLAYTWRRCQA